MIALLEFIFFLIVFPVLLFTFVAAKLVLTISEAFRVRLLLVAIWIGTLSALLWSHQTPDDKLYISIIDTIAQWQVFGFNSPTLLLLAASAFLVLSLKRSSKQPA